MEIPGGIVAGRGAKSAYLFPADRNGALALAYHLLKAGYRLAVATQPIEAGGKTLAARNVGRARRAQRQHPDVAGSTRSRARAASR